MTSSEELRKHAVQESDFASCSDEARIPLGSSTDSTREGNEIHCIFNFPEDEWVLADLSELHNHVLETLYRGGAAVVNHEKRHHLFDTHRYAPINVRLVIREHLVLLHILVQLTLQRRHLALDNLLNLVRQFALHVFL